MEFFSILFFLSALSELPVKENSSFFNVFACLLFFFLAHDNFFIFCFRSIAAAFLTQTVQLDDSTVKFEIWDTAGQERYRSLAPMYYRYVCRFSSSIINFGLKRKGNLIILSLFVVVVVVVGNTIEVLLRQLLFMTLPIPTLLLEQSHG